MNTINKYLISEKNIYGGKTAVIVNNKKELWTVLNTLGEFTFLIPDYLKNVKIFPFYLTIGKSMIKGDDEKSNKYTYISFSTFLNNYEHQ